MGDVHHRDGHHTGTHRHGHSEGPSRADRNGCSGSCTGTPIWLRKNRRACPGERYQPTNEEHVANVFTHGISIIPAVCGTVYLLLTSSSTMHSFVAVVYGCSLIALFGCSTAFHGACYLGSEGRVRFFLHICDRATIFLFIACSYTPWLLLKEADPYVRGVLVFLWFMVCGGICYQCYFHEKYKHFETFLYLFMGICPGLVCVPGMVNSNGIARVVEGGVVYVIGVVFFKSDGIIPFAHAIWHLFVIVGASWHFFAVVSHLYAAVGSGQIDGFVR